MPRLLFAMAATLVLVVVNGVFIADEFAIVRVRRTRREELAGEGQGAAVREAPRGESPSC